MIAKATSKSGLFYLNNFNSNKNQFKKATLFITLISLVLFTTLSFGQITLNSRQTGNWNSINTWVSNNLAGTITTSTSTNRTTVTGNGTTFLTQLSVGSILYRADGTTVIGTIASINSNTSITLSANAANANTNANFVTRKIPTVLDIAILLNNGFDVTIPTGYAAFCATLEIGVTGTNTAEFLNFFDAYCSPKKEFSYL